MATALWRIIFLLINLTGRGVHCHILSVPDHVLVSAGSNARFSCRSTVANSISWRYKPVSGGEYLLLSNGVFLPSGTSLSISVRAADKISSWSTLALRGVGKQDSVTLKCSDNDGAAFAHLTVVSDMSGIDNGQPSGLTLCPTDVVTTTGESVVLQVAGKPGSLLRWYRLLAGGQEESVIYTGEKMDYKQVDERYSVAVSRNNETNFLIRSVKPADAAQFTVREEFSGQSAVANLVVIEPATLRCGVEVVGQRANFFCEVEYRGSIQPTAKWIFEGNGEPVDRTPTYTYMYGRYESRLTVSAADRSEWPSSCQIAFSRQSCNESRAAYTRTIHCQSSDSIRPALSMSNGMPIVIVVVSILVSVTIMSVTLVLVCARQRRSMKPDGETADYTQRKYETIRNSSSEARALSPPSYENVVNRENPYEEPIFT